MRQRHVNTLAGMLLVILGVGGIPASATLVSAYFEGVITDVNPNLGLGASVALGDSQVIRVPVDSPARRENLLSSVRDEVEANTMKLFGHIAEGGRGANGVEGIS